jgi:DNA-binding MarR family transcriptional regulator
MASKPDTGAPRLGCTCARLRKATRRVSQIYDRHLAPFGLTITQYGLLAQLRRLDGVSIGALAETLIMDPTTLSRNLRPMEKRGLVRLVPDPNDRRSRQLHLTAEGRAAQARAKPAWAQAQRHVEDTLGPGEAVTLNDVLDRSLDRLAG